VLTTVAERPAAKQLPMHTVVLQIVIAANSNTVRKVCVQHGLSVRLGAIAASQYRYQVQPELRSGVLYEAAGVRCVMEHEEALFFL
jgi:hypothetical protein